MDVRSRAWRRVLRVSLVYAIGGLGGGVREGEGTIMGPPMGGETQQRLRDGDGGLDSILDLRAMKEGRQPIWRAR